MNTSLIYERLLRLYGKEEAAAVWPLVQERLVTVCPGEDRPLWSEKDAILITYGDSVVVEGEVPLRTLARFVRTYLKDAVSIVHILPFCPYTSDDGFSISDYEVVRPDLGDWTDVAALRETHDVMFDLVLNHCSASHVWFQQFLKNEAPGKDFFHALDPETDVREVVRPRTHPLLTPFDTADGEKWIWTTFSADQVDLNFSNPEVLLAFLDILLLYAKQGARIIRLDAIAFLWKTAGTDCLHLPETHEVVKLMRDVLELAAPGVILLTETNVPHAENVSYFGNGDEARMVYQFPLPPLLLHALRRGDPEALTRWLRNLEAPTEGCTFFNFTASHDGIGVRPLEGLVPMEEVKALAEDIRATGGKVNERSHPDGSTTPYELNATYFSALGMPGDTPEDHLKRFVLSQTVPMCLQGIPAFYLHSFTATPNDLEGMARTGQNRSINRRIWQWAEVEERFSDAGQAASKVVKILTERLEIRSGISAFHPDVPQEILDAPDGCLLIRRGDVVAVHNMSAETVAVPLPVSEILLQEEGVEIEGSVLKMPPLSVCWVR
jgi:sucrose phosphorylase